MIELIGYRILGGIITLISLGLAYAWAQKLIINYKIEHTVYNGKRLKFEGTGASLFVEMFKWIFFSIITFGIYLWWVPLKKEKWIWKNTHFEDEEFIKGDSYFDGGLLGLIGVNLLTNFLILISFGLLYPFVICYKLKWFAKHTIINRKRIVFRGTALSLIGNYLLWWFLTIITFGIFALWLQIKIWKWQTKHTYIKMKNEQEPEKSKQGKLSLILLIVTIILVIAIICGITYFISTIDFSGNNNGNGDKSLPEFLQNILPKNFQTMNFDESKAISSISGGRNDSYVAETGGTENGNRYNGEKYYRNTSLTLVDAVACYGASDHISDMVATIEKNGDISVSQSLGAVLLENTNAKYLFKVAKIAADNVDLYYITNNNDLYVIRTINASSYNQRRVKATNSKVAEFLGTTEKSDGEYIKVLLTNGYVEEIPYLLY